jgi:glucokinase
VNHAVHVADPVVLAFDVGGTSIKASAFDSSLEELATTVRPSPQGPAVLDAIVDCAEDLLAALDDETRRRVAAAGVALPGLVDPGAGVAVRSVNLELSALEVTGPLQRRLGLPVQLGHDVGAAGDAVRRLDPGAADPFVVVIGTGIAAASFVGGHAITGVSGQAGELGHVVVRPGGPLCACGRHGCLETIASAGAIARRYASASGREVAGAHEVVDLVATDPLAAEVWTSAIDALADAFLFVSAVLAPGEIVLAGGLAEAGDRLVSPVAAAMAARTGVLNPAPVRTSSLGSRAGVLGAGLLALDLLALDLLASDR